MTRPRRGSRGSVLMLMPAGVLVVLLLGAIAFDLSLVFLRQRQASAVAVDVANDLAGLALDEDAFRSDGVIRLDPDLAEDMGREVVASSDLADAVVDLEVDLVSDTAVEVRLVVEVDYVFAKAIPGAAEGTTVTAAATAVIAP